MSRRTDGDREGWTRFFLEAVTTRVEAGVLTETSGRRRDRTFGYAAYLDPLRVGTDL